MLELSTVVDDAAQENLLSDYYGDVENVPDVYPKVRYQFLVDMPKERPLYSNTAAAPGLKYTPRGAGGRARCCTGGRRKNVAKVVTEPGMPGWADVASRRCTCPRTRRTSRWAATGGAW